jgi:Amt family ammonium transporter
LYFAGAAHGQSTCVKTGCVDPTKTFNVATQECEALAIETGYAAAAQGPTAADAADAAAANAADMDNTWLLLGGFLVFFMQSGFALLEVGSVSVRNTQNILFKNMIDPTIAAILFWAVGFSITGLGADSATGFIGAFDATTFSHGVDNQATPAVGTCTSPSCADIDLEVFTVADSCAAATICEDVCTAAHADCVFEETPVEDTDGYNGSFWATWFFQWAFCATAATIVSGAVAERILFGVYIIVTIFLTGFVYPVVVHWGWAGDGWASAWVSNVHTDALFGVGVIDFAGSGVVHMTGGVAALVVCWFIGPRHGRFVKHYKKDGHTYAKTADQPLLVETAEEWMEIVEDEQSPSGEMWQSVSPEILSDLKASPPSEFQWKVNAFPASSSTFQTFGVLILWFGWYGFNCGSTLGISGAYSQIAAKVAVTTTLGAAGGGLSSAVLTYLFETKTFDLGAIGNGVLAGLVSITAPCPVVEPWAAIFIGLIGGGVYFSSCKLLLKLQIDDVVSASPVHMFCGMWGVLTPGLFATQKNWGMAYATLAGAVTESCMPAEADECTLALEPAFQCTFTPGLGEASCKPTSASDTLYPDPKSKCVYTPAGDPLPDDGGVPCGIFYGCDNSGSQLAAQVVFILAILAWVGGTIAFICLVLKMVVGDLAYEPAVQRGGMDKLKHGGISSPETHTAYTGLSTTTLQRYLGTPSSPSKSAIAQPIPQPTLPISSPMIKPATGV